MKFCLIMSIDEYILSVIVLLLTVCCVRCLTLPPPPCKLLHDKYLSSIGKSSDDIAQKLAICYANNGHMHDAAILFEDAYNKKPALEHLFNSAMSYHRIKKYDDSLRLYNLCMVNYQYRACYIKAASIYRDLEDYTSTQQCLIQAIQLQPDNPDAYSYLGDIYNNLKHWNEAITMYTNAIERNPTVASYWTSKGDTLNNLKRTHEALACFNQARQLQSIASTASGKAANDIPTPSMLTSLIGYYFTALDLGHWKSFEVDGVLMQNYTMYSVQMNLMNQGPPSPLSPYRNLFIETKPQLFYHVSRSWSNEIAVGVLSMYTQHTQHAPSHVNHDIVATSTSSSNCKCDIRIGYISRRFEDYPGTQMMLRVFANHNKSSKMCVYVYANGKDDKSIERKIVEDTSDYFNDISALSYNDAAAVIHADKIDVLIDYDGVHDYNSMKILSLVPSSIQVTWLGFAGTTGQGHRSPPAAVTANRADTMASNGNNKYKPAIQYMIADKYVLPPDSSHFNYYSEHVVYMPHTYQPQDEYQDALLQEKAKSTTASTTAGVADAPTTSIISRNSPIAQAAKHYNRRILLERYTNITAASSSSSSNGSSSSSSSSSSYVDSITHGMWLISFNRQAKITPDAFSDWMLILQSNSNSYLILMAESTDAIMNLQMSASYHGIASSRLIFLNRLSRVDYRCVLHSSDIFLDTYYYGAHTVASDAMFGNVPVLTISSSQSFSSSVATGLNAAAGIDMYVNAINRKDVLTMVDLYCNSRHGGVYTLLQGISSIMRRNEHLFNSQSFTKQLEYAYLGLHNINMVGTKPMHLIV